MKLKISTILVDFASWSTVACIRFIAYSESRWLRFFWLIMFLVMLAAFIVQLVLIVLKYISYPADTSTTIVFASQPFPDVTICSFNPFKRSVVATNADFAEIKGMLDEYTAVEQGKGGSNSYGFQGLDRFARLDRANDLLVFLAAKLTEEQKDPAMYTVEELVTECLFAGTTCDPDLLVPVPDPVYGRCFVYKGANKTITRPGLQHGLRLIVTANVRSASQLLHDSLTFATDYLPTTTRVGVRMTVNDEDALVELDNRGFNVGVGYQTSIALSKSRTERIKAPYGDCVDEIAPSMNHYSEYPYTIDACFTTCTQKRIVERCGCAHPIYRKADNETRCSTPEHATCVATLRGGQTSASSANLNQLSDCGCKNPCTESYFVSTLSVLTYPAYGYTVGVGTTEQMQQQHEEQQKEQESLTTAASATTIEPMTNRPTTSAKSMTTSATAASATRDITTTIAKTTTTEPPWVTNCTEIQNLIKAASSEYGIAGNVVGAATPTVYFTDAHTHWYKHWPCSYKCADGTRFPTNPEVDNVKCVDFFNCFKINTDRLTIKPTFTNWTLGGTGKDDCAAMQDTGTGSSVSGGRKKRAAPVDPPTTTISTAKSMGAPGKGSCEAWNTNFKSVDDCRTWYKKNGMIVNVYYESLEYQVLTENAAYSIPQAINDLGGQAGLWLGLSVISVVECAGLLLILLLFCITGKRMTVRLENETRIVQHDNTMPARQ